MIISHSNRFIFIKTRKTAGSSLQKAFSLACKPGDILIGSPAILPSWADPSMAIPSKIHAGKNWIREEYPRQWSEYTKVTAERHPLDKVVSLYWWDTRDDRTISFRDWFDSSIDAYFTDFILYGDKSGQVLVDHVIRFENIQSDYDSVCRELGLTTFSLDREKTGFRPKENSVAPYFTDEMLARVRRIFRREIDAFGYDL